MADYDYFFLMSIFVKRTIYYISTIMKILLYDQNIYKARTLIYKKAYLHFLSEKGVVIAVNFVIGLRKYDRFSRKFVAKNILHRTYRLTKTIT